MNEARMRMTRIPKGADLVVNKVSGAPGIWIGNVIVMAGVPVDHAGHARRGRAEAQDRHPHALADRAGRCARRATSAPSSARSPRPIPEVAIGSYPFFDPQHGPKTNVVCARAIAKARKRDARGGGHAAAGAGARNRAAVDSPRMRRSRAAANALVISRELVPDMNQGLEGGGGNVRAADRGGRHAQRTPSHAPPTAGRGAFRDDRDHRGPRRRWRRRLPVTPQCQ
jgi:hypothetical protein